MAADCTTAQEVYDSFESSFRDKNVIPESLERIWLLKAIARYSVELDRLDFNEDNNAFTSKLDMYVISTLAAFMKQSYQEREVSKVNKRVSIVTKEISVDGNGNTKTAAREELSYDASKSEYMIANQMPTAYV